MKMVSRMMMIKATHGKTGMRSMIQNRNQERRMTHGWGVPGDRAKWGARWRASGSGWGTRGSDQGSGRVGARGRSGSGTERLAAVSARAAASPGSEASETPPNWHPNSPSPSRSPKLKAALLASSLAGGRSPSPGPAPAPRAQPATPGSLGGAWREPSPPRRARRAFACPPPPAEAGLREAAGQPRASLGRPKQRQHPGLGGCKQPWKTGFAVSPALLLPPRPGGLRCEGKQGCSCCWAWIRKVRAQEPEEGAGRPWKCPRPWGPAVLAHPRCLPPCKSCPTWATWPRRRGTLSWQWWTGRRKRRKKKKPCSSKPPSAAPSEPPCLHRSIHHSLTQSSRLCGGGGGRGCWVRAQAPALGPGALGMGRAEVGGIGGRRGCHRVESPGARRGWLETRVQRRVGWTETTLRLGCAEAEKSWSHPCGRALGGEQVRGQGISGRKGRREEEVLRIAPLLFLELFSRVTPVKAVSIFIRKMLIFSVHFGTHWSHRSRLGLFGGAVAILGTLPPSFSLTFYSPSFTQIPM